MPARLAAPIAGLSLATCRIPRRFLRDDRGAATVEAVLWLPVFIAFLALMVDTALMFGSQSRALRVVQDANRTLSVGRFTTPEETQDYVRGQLLGMSPNVFVSTVVESGIISTVAVIPAADVVATGLITTFADLQISVSAQHMSEN